MCSPCIAQLSDGVISSKASTEGCETPFIFNHDYGTCTTDVFYARTLNFVWPGIYREADYGLRILTMTV